MARPLLLLAVIIVAAGCSQRPSADLQYVKQARSLASEWALINQQAADGKLTGAYVASMHRWLRRQLETTSSSLARPDSGYGKEVRGLLATPDNAAPDKLRASAGKLRQIEISLESA